MKIIYVGKSTFVSDLEFIPNEVYEVSDEKGNELLSTFGNWFEKVSKPEVKAPESKEQKDVKPKVKG